jgi:hypothetical protein
VRERVRKGRESRENKNGAALLVRAIPYLSSCRERVYIRIHPRTHANTNKQTRACTALGGTHVHAHAHAHAERETEREREREGERERERERERKGATHGREHGVVWRRRQFHFPAVECRSRRPGRRLVRCPLRTAFHSLA